MMFFFSFSGTASGKRIDGSLRNSFVGKASASFKKGVSYSKDTRFSFPRSKKKRGISSSVVIVSTSFDPVPLICSNPTFAQPEHHVKIYFSGNGKRGPPLI
jgi:hypothetical protein